ncbi:MAG: sensor histidine kinase [Pirellulales bacterium]
MRFAWISALTRTLRFRLTVWNALVVLLTGVLALVGVREGVRRTLVKEFDQQLREDMREIRLALSETGDAVSPALQRQLDRKARGHSAHGWFVQLIDHGGHELFSSVNVPRTLPPAINSKKSWPVDHHNVRVIEQTVVQPVAMTVRVGASRASIQAEVDRIDRLVGVALGMVLIVAPLSGYLLAGRATRPLAAILRTASRLRPARLDERLPIRGTGDELDRLAVTFNRLLDRVADFLTENRDFLANAAHELRTPLAAIRSSVEVALTSERTREEYQELLGEIIQESDALEGLVRQLLLLAETEADRLLIHGERIQFDPIVASAVDMFGGVAESRGIRLVIGRLDEVEIEGSRQHLRQVINNLIDNAVKFTPAGGTIEVELKVAGNEQSSLLRVRDTGVGIDPQHVEHLFKRFYRVNRSHRRDGDQYGTGLGLSICEAVVCSHGGRIAVESRVGVGTTFSVELPLAGQRSGERPSI